MKVKVYNLVRHTWLIVANNLLMLGLSSFRRKLFDFQAFQAHIINLSGIIIYFCGTGYLYAVCLCLRPMAVIPLVRFSALGFRLFPLHSYLRLLTFTYTCLTFLQYILAIIRTFDFTNHFNISYKALNRPLAHLGKMQYTTYR